MRKNTGFSEKAEILRRNEWLRDFFGG